MIGKTTILLALSFFLLVSCNTGQMDHSGHTDKESLIYECPMHPEVQSRKSGKCSKCGMELLARPSVSSAHQDIALESYLKPTNAYVLGNVQLITPLRKNKKVSFKTIGNIDYDLRRTGTVSARISGRIEKLFVQYRYQKVSKGEKLMEIYSPEILTAGSNLLFILKYDSENTKLKEAAVRKLELLGMSEIQINDLIRTGKLESTISIYSDYSGHIHDNGTDMEMANLQPMQNATTAPLKLKTGMYVEQGQTLFQILNPDKAAAILHIYQNESDQISIGDTVDIYPESSKTFKGMIHFIEPFLREGNKTTLARVYFDNTTLQIPIGTQVSAEISTGSISALWIPATGVLELGKNQAILLKHGKGFRVKKVITGIRYNDEYQVIQGISETDSIVKNAQYLIDREGFLNADD